MSETKVMPISELPENQVNGSSIQKIEEQHAPLPPQEKNSDQNNPPQQEDLKFGQYYLTPLQSIILNKKFPHGYKLETEENILKSIEMIKAQEKRHKQSIKNNNQQLGRRSSYKGNNQNSKTKYTSNAEKIPNNITTEKFKIYKQCLAGFEKLKESKFFQRFNFPYEPGAPCLSAVEKKILNYEYNTLYEFEMDVRNIWNFFFRMNINDEMAKKMSEDWEKICTELENPNAEINNLNVKDIKKKLGKIEEDLANYKENRGAELPPPPTKKTNQNNDHNKPMTVEEKNKLGNDIRNLTKEQLKGIIKILNESDSYPKTKYFEFDIDKLSNKKLRELEKYVKDCMNINLKNKSQNQNAQHNTNNKNQKENINNKTNMATTANTSNINNDNQQSNIKNKEINKNNEIKKEMASDKKIKQNTAKKEKNEPSSDSLSSDSDSSLSN